MRDIISGDSEKLPFELRIYSMSTFVNMLLVIGAIAGSALSSLPLYIHILNTLYLLACGIFYFLSRFRQRAYPLVYLVVTQVFLSLIWFANGGLKGSIPYFFFVLLLVALIVCRIRPLMTTLLVAGNLLLLIGIEFFHPGWVVPYRNESTHFFDIATSVPLILVLLAFWISMLKTSYDGERFIDPLTRLNNRQHTLNLLNQFISQRKISDLSIAFFDVDHFKKLNDTYGHNMGDQVLSKMGDILRECLRDNDISGRYGGEEFLVALPNTIKGNALQTLERIRNRVSETWFVIGSASVRTSISVGLVSLREDGAHIGKELGLNGLLARMFPDRSSSVDWEQVSDLKMRVVSEMIRIADDLMYRAKMTECQECGYQSKLDSEFQDDVCPRCGSSAVIPGRNRIMTL